MTAVTVETQSGTECETGFLPLVLGNPCFQEDPQDPVKRHKLKFYSNVHSVYLWSPGELWRTAAFTFLPSAPSSPGIPSGPLGP